MYFKSALRAKIQLVVMHAIFGRPQKALMKINFGLANRTHKWVPIYFFHTVLAKASTSGQD